MDSFWFYVLQSDSQWNIDQKSCDYAYQCGVRFTGRVPVAISSTSQLTLQKVTVETPLDLDKIWVNESNNYKATINNKIFKSKIFCSWKRNAWQSQFGANWQLNLLARGASFDVVATRSFISCECELFGSTNFPWREVFAEFALELVSQIHFQMSGPMRVFLGAMFKKSWRAASQHRRLGMTRILKLTQTTMISYPTLLWDFRCPFGALMSIVCTGHIPLHHEKSTAIFYTCDLSHWSWWQDQSEIFER